MQEKNENMVARPINATMHFLGSATRSIRDGFYCIAPFMKPEMPSPAMESRRSIEILPSTLSHAPQIKKLPPTHVAASVVEKEAPILEKIPKRKESVMEQEKQADVDDLLRGVAFESQLERIQAEVYLRDLNSHNTKEREQAFMQIEKLSRPATLSILKNMLATKKDPLQIIEVLNALSHYNSDLSLSKRVFTDFLTQRDPIVRLTALRALSKYKDEEGFAILSSFLKDADAEIRRQVLNLLCWTYRDKSIPAIVTLMHDVDNRVRKTAIQFCGAFKIRQTISGLITLLSDEDKQIQKSVAESLRKITGENFGFKVNGSKKDKEDAIEAWRFWWRENQIKFRIE